MYRFRLLALAAFCLAPAGCVEGEVVYTVNPDGSAKVTFDVVTVKPFEPFGGGPMGPPMPGQPPMKMKREEDKDIDDLLRDALRPLLQTQNVYAWKDVQSEWLPNGKLRIRGTAYVKNVADFKPNSPPLLSANVMTERGADGSFKLVAKKGDNGTPGPGPGPNQRKRKTQDEIKKMTDDELDKYVLRDLIELQTMRRMFEVILGGAKMKVTYAVPGDPGEAPGFTRDGRKLSHSLEGNKILEMLDKMLAQDKAAWRKLYRESASADPLHHLNLGADGPVGPTATITVAKPMVQFDFAKEVKEARDAYPALKKKFGFTEGDDVRLPTEDPRPIPPPPPPPPPKP